MRQLSLRGLNKAPSAVSEQHGRPSARSHSRATCGQCIRDRSLCYIFKVCVLHTLVRRAQTGFYKTVKGVALRLTAGSNFKRHAKRPSQLGQTSRAVTRRVFAGFLCCYCTGAHLPRLGGNGWLKIYTITLCASASLQIGTLPHLCVAALRVLFALRMLRRSRLQLLPRFKLLKTASNLVGYKPKCQMLELKSICQVVTFRQTLL